jgi:hypothetical protein
MTIIFELYNVSLTLDLGAATTVAIYNAMIIRSISNRLWKDQASRAKHKRMGPEIQK